MALKKTVILLVILLVSGTILFFFNPEGNEESIWFPKCMFHYLTGFNCPSCGIQRAGHHLLHLRFREAFLYNPFLVISVPYALAVLAVWAAPASRLEGLRRFCYHRYTLWTYLVLVFAWWIVRNIIHM